MKPPSIKSPLRTSLSSRTAVALNRSGVLFVLGTLALLWIGTPTAAAALSLACAKDNDLFRTLRASGPSPARYDDAATAIRKAPVGSAVLLLADNYPHAPLQLTEELYAQARKKRLRMLVEFPSLIPGIPSTKPRKTEWERFVVSTEQWAPTLPKHRLLMAHDCHVIPVRTTNAWVVVARVAGYDQAVYGIPSQADSIIFPIEDGSILIATTKLSNFITGRYAPTLEWTELWHRILTTLTDEKLPNLRWQPLVTATYGPTDPLPSGLEKESFRRAASWVERSRLLVSESRWPALSNLMMRGLELGAMPASSDRSADGRRGILEGYGSAIEHDGEQPQRLPIRADCQAESAMGLALDGLIFRHRRHTQIASNLLDFLYFTSDLCGGSRGNPEHPAFGLISWGSTMPTWMVANYGDDNARTMLATILAASALKSSRWDEALLRSLVANERTTGELGFRGDRVDIAPLETHGWRHYRNSRTINYSPHFEAYSWACFLWAYDRTGAREFLDRTKTAIRMTMAAFPHQWRWDDNMERAHMLLCLAWLVRIEDTPEHRDWLRRVSLDLISVQQPNGALLERFRATKGSHYQIPASNEAYGTGETPLLHHPGDPVTDQLYVGGFALLGLHEAVAVLKDPELQAAEDRLAAFLCRVQIRSPKLPYLDGTWFRAFDIQRWEAWASSGDAGWGAWSIEAGWAQAWTTAVLGLRSMRTTLWELSRDTRIKDSLPGVQRQMSRNQGGPWKAPTPAHQGSVSPIQP